MNHRWRLIRRPLDCDPLETPITTSLAPPSTESLIEQHLLRRRWSGGRAEVIMPVADYHEGE